MPSLTKQAFSKVRQNISSSAFKELLQLSTNVNYFYKDTNLWHSYRLLAIDGTTLQVPNTDENKKYFGQSLNQISGVAQPRMSL